MMAPWVSASEVLSFTLFYRKKIIHCRTDKLISIQAVPHYATYYLVDLDMEKYKLFFRFPVICQHTLSCRRYHRGCVRMLVFP